MTNFIKNCFIWPGALSDEPLTFKQGCEIQRRQMAVCDIDWCGVEVEVVYPAPRVGRLHFIRWWMRALHPKVHDFEYHFTANQQTCIWEVRL